VTTQDVLVGTKKRLSFQNAFNELLRSSQLKKLTENPHLAHEWADALSVDCIAVDNLLNRLAADLKTITGCSVEVNPFSIAVFKHACDQTHKNSAECVNELFNLLSSMLKVFIEKIAFDSIKKTDFIRSEYKNNRIVNVYETTFFPLNPVFTNGDTVIFTAIEKTSTGEKLNKITLASYSYVDPYDHVMKMPRSVLDKLIVLRKTHFDYSPKVLRGIQVGKTEINLKHEEVHLKHDQDPALVIHLGTEHAPHVVEFWGKPTHQSVHTNQPQLPPKTKTCFQVSSMIALGLIPFIFCSQSDMSPTYIFLLCLLGAFLILLGSWFAYKYFRALKAARCLFAKVQRHTLVLN
jgi:hypothetical protein